MALSRKTRRWIWALGAAALLGWLFYPLGDPRFAIVWDSDKLDFHRDFLAKAPATDTQPRPNIVILLADDLALMELSCYGGQHLQTPHLDALAAQGIRCTNGYVTSPICSPSRAGLLTGRYQQRYGFEHILHDRYPSNRLEYLVYKYWFATEQWQVAQRELAVPDAEALQRQGLPPTEFTLAELLKRHGYETAIVGKWHLGYHSWAIPNRRGFDFQYGFYEAYSLYLPESHAEAINIHHDDFSDQFIWQKARTGACAIRQNDSIVSEDEHYLTDRLADVACDWLRKPRNAPFFLYVPFSAPHTPFQTIKKYHDSFAHVSDPNKRVYYSMILALDEAVGKITQTLRESGLEENTLIFFLSDNGGALYTHASSNLPLKGGKFSNFEGGLNVPFLVKWPKILPANQVYPHPVSSLDVFQTCIAAARAELPTDRGFDGVDLRGFLAKADSTKAIQRPHEALFWRSGYHRAVRAGRWKLLTDERGGEQALYDLETDKYEQRDLAKAHPDTVRMLEARFREWEKQMVNPAWPHVMDFCFKDGERVYYFPL